MSSPDAPKPTLTGAPQSVASGPTPAFDVRRTRLIPPALIDPQGVPQSANWPQVTTQEVQGYASDGSTVRIGSRSTQAGPNEQPRVTGSGIAIERGAVRYSVDLNPDGSISGTGSAAGVRMDPAEVANLAQYFDRITDENAVSGATLDTVLAQFRQSSGIERK